MVPGACLTNQLPVFTSLCCFAFHYSHDAHLWHMVRAFQLHHVPVRAGFLVQSPQGPGCCARFSEISCRPDTLADIRSGE